MSHPLVSVLTPVYNGAEYLAECIESVLAQSYDNWEYIILNNRSTDRTLEIANEYARREKRIKVLTDKFVGVIENHNRAFRAISANSQYCKVVSADDWLYPECIEQLVRLAEGSPAVGVVQSYVINATGVRWNGLSVKSPLENGRQIARLYLLGKIDLAAPSANLYRSSLVRSLDPFFPGARESADIAGCLNCLRRSDFGIVHQILSFERLHDGAVTAKVHQLDSYLLDRIGLLLDYGPMFLTLEEMNVRREAVLRYYYQVLAASIVNVRGEKYWSYHRARLTELGLSFNGARLSKAVIVKMLDLVLNPKQTVEKALRRVTQRSKRAALCI